MKSDPFAPANSPRHVKNLSAAFAPDTETLDALARQEELQRLHMTGHEGPGNVPDVEELERRQTLVDEYREQLATEGPDAEPPALEDLTGNLYTWREGDRTEDDAEEPSGQPDGETSSGWYFVGELKENDPAGGLAVPPRNGPGSDTDTWRAFASAATGTEPAGWATLSRTEIIAKLEQDGAIPSEQA